MRGVSAVGRPTSRKAREGGHPFSYWAVLEGEWRSDRTPERWATRPSGEGDHGADSIQIRIDAREVGAPHLDVGFTSEEFSALGPM
jgi:hypothetical protein